jgi:hypothetical protein
MKISNNKLLEMNEFKYCAFKELLLKALGLSNMNKVMLENKRAEEAELMEDLEDNEEDFYDEEKKKEEILRRIEDEKKKAELEKSMINNNYMDSDRNKNDILILNENKVDEENEVGEKPLHLAISDNIDYIDFKMFCNIMKLFNAKFPVDMKIKCKTCLFSLL